ncbi:MAG: glutathione synthase [Bacteriovoracaceae bacterium]|nr:glutathione synthase [Bacteriovoracaceae bacterium]
MKALMIADPIEKLKPAGDTSLFISQSLLNKKIETYFATAEDLVWEHSEVFVHAKKVLSSEKGRAPLLGSSEKFGILDFKLLFIRKDPPFDSSYVKLCWLLKPFENEIRIVNRPSVLLDHHEKMLPLEAVAENFLKAEDIIPTCIASSIARALDFVNALSTDKVVLKPYFGFGGSDIFLLNRKNFEAEAKEHFDKNSDWIVQPFEDSVKTKGDCRVFFICGKYAGAFARLPKSGGYVSNLAKGGTAVLRELTEKESDLIDRCEKWVQRLEIDFVGADFIAEKLNEMNITSPTGFVNFESLTGKNLGDRLIEGLLHL